MMPEVISFIYDNLIHQAGFTEGQYSVRVRSLENDFPDYQGMAIYRITFPDLRRILIWSMQNSPEPEDKIKEELVNYLESSGSLCGILLFRSGILQVCRHDDFTYKWNPNIQNLKEKLSGDIVPYRLSFIRIIEEYLEGIYQTVSRIFFRTYGESEIESREFQILSVIINILILKMAEKHGIQISDDNEKSLLYTLKSFACEIPYHTDVCVNPSGILLSIIHTMVNAGLLVSLPDQVKISWIEPLLVTRVLGNIIEKRRLSGRQKKFRIIDEREEDFLLSSAIFGNVLNRIRREYQRVPVIVDPACCEGEILISLMRYETGSDRVDCRLKQVATLLYGADPSISNIMLVKFGLVLRIIDSAFTDPSLLQVISPDYILQMREHIRVGSCILIRDTVIDCISEDDRRKVITALPPLNHHWPDPSPLMPAILMSFPKNQVFETEPALKDYICRYFTSYSEGIDYSLLVVEHILNFTDYPAYIFLNMKWLSDARSARFRKWLKKSRMDHIILEYSENKNIGNYPLSVISGRENSGMITISIVKNDGIWQSHPQNPASLPDTDGWNLKDPRISLLSDKIRKNSISLYEYCLGEIYRSDEINLEREDESWISFIRSGRSLIFITHIRPDPGAYAIIKGPDHFLEGVLRSSLIQWYWQNLPIIGEQGNPFRSLSELPIRQPDWYEPADSAIVEAITYCIVKMKYLINLRSYIRHYHDRVRIDAGIIKLQKELDNAVIRLYQIPPDIQSIIEEIHSNSSFIL